MDKKTKIEVAEKKKPGTVQSKAPTYTKEQILQFGKYANRIDLVGALLEDDKAYTQSEVDTKLNKFLNRGKK